MTLDQFIAKHRITIDVENVPDRSDMPAAARDPTWDREARHWRCVLRCGRRRMTVYFSQGSAIHEDPSAADLLDCMASDAAGIENAPEFEEWAREYGYDTDSRKAEAVYRATRRQSEKLGRFLPDEARDALLYHVDRL